MKAEVVDHLPGDYEQRRTCSTHEGRYARLDVAIILGAWGDFQLFYIRRFKENGKWKRTADVKEGG